MVYPGLWGSSQRQNSPCNCLMPQSFLAPEVLAGKAPTAQSAIYAVGGVCYTLHTARLPFHAETGNKLDRMSAGSSTLSSKVARDSLEHACKYCQSCLSWSVAVHVHALSACYGYVITAGAGLKLGMCVACRGKIPSIERAWRSPLP